MRISFNHRVVALCCLFLAACGDEASTSTPDTSVTVDAGSNDISQGDCLSASECDDGISCTVDSCLEGVCSWRIEDDQCFINGACRDTGTVQDCGVCAPSLSQKEWSTAPNGTT